MKVAVVILNWNGKSFLEKFLPSVLTNNSSYSEIIVADNCSTDDSISFLKNHYPEIRIIQNADNGGFAKGYNDALKLVKSEYYVLLNSDVEVTAGWIDHIINLMDKDKSIAACQPKIKSYYNKMNNSTRQFFILGLRFQGYDERGNVISASDTFHQDNFNVANDSGGVFERFFDIYISSFKFKLDGKVTVYNIEATPIGPGTALGVKRGRIDKGLKVQGMTVDDALQGPNGLLTILNKEQKKIADADPNKESIPTEYI